MTHDRDRFHWWQQLSQNALRVTFVIAALLLLANLVRSVNSNYSVSRHIRTLTSQIELERDRQTIVKEAISYYQSDTYKELEARRRLGLARPGETLVLVPDNRDVITPGQTMPTSPSDHRSDARRSWDEQPPYEQWWLLFFGPSSLLEDAFST